MNDLRGFHCLPSSLCQSNVNESQPQKYYILRLDSAYARSFSSNAWHWDPKTKHISLGDFKSTWNRTYPSLTDEKRSSLFHRRCFDFAKELSPARVILKNRRKPSHTCELQRNISRSAYFITTGIVVQALEVRSKGFGR